MSQSASSAFIGNVNPFRYRGYYFDVETGLYYLQSRYYDPEVGRFISQDLVDYVQKTDFGGLNLYAYCGNNPVMYVDPSGKFLLSIAIIVGLAVIGAIVGGVKNGIAASKNGSSGWDLFGKILLGALVGGLVGAATGGLLVATISGMVGGIMAMAGKAIAKFMFMGAFLPRTFAIGLLFYNGFALLVAPLLGMELEAVGYPDLSKQSTLPEPQRYTHPAGKSPVHRLAAQKTLLEVL